MNKTHIISTSGGMGSYFAARQVVQQYGMEHVILLFADTYIEDDDLYRFLLETTAHLYGEKYDASNVELASIEDMSRRKRDIDRMFSHFRERFPRLVRLVDGRDVWQVIFERGVLNHRFDHCSEFLKRNLLWKWIKKNYHSTECVVYLGIDWTESHRLDKVRSFRKPYEVDSPLCYYPYLSKKRMMEICEQEDGIRIPRLYEMGFSHNNCGGFCIKAGQKHFKTLLEKLPERFKFHENKEQEFQKQTGRTNTVLLKMENKMKRQYSLKELREDVEKSVPIDETEYGGCGCALD